MGDGLELGGEPVILVMLLRCAGAGLIVLAALHAVFWHTLGWKQDLTRVTPLTQRVFLVHTVVIVGMLLALGLLSLLRPGLLLAPGELVKAVLIGVVALWTARMLAQPLIFNAAMTQGWVASRWVHAGATLLWLGFASVYGAALACQFDVQAAFTPAPMPMDAPATWLRLAVAGVWLVFGLVFKLLDAVPRHREIVARVMGERWSRLVIVCVALGEMGLGLWMLHGQRLVACAALQTAGIVVMNALELRLARDLLLAPRLMLLGNAVLLASAWIVALT